MFEEETEKTRRMWGVTFQEKGIPFMKLPTSVHVALFFIVVVVQLSVHKVILDKNDLPSMLAIGLSIILLAYVCLATSLTRIYASGRGLRQQLNIALVWLLFAALIMINVASLSSSYRLAHPGRNIGSILLVLLVVIFASSLCDRVRLLRQMPHDHWLFATSTCLTAFVVFVGNPISLYVSSSDFSGGIYGVTATVIMYFVVVVLVLTSLYMLVDETVQNGLTLLSVFSAFVVVSYSMVGMKGAGVMSEFILPIPEALIRTRYEIVAEIAVLLTLFAAIAYVTYYYRQSVTRVAGAMLVASICAVAADVYGAKDEAVAVSNRLPVDHADIISFSQDRNVLILMLDGFPGGYMERIKKESPDALKEYEGFVWYPNMLTTNSGTLGSIATLAGGHKYTVQEVNKRGYLSVGNAINEAYGVYADAFIQEGYQVTYANPSFAGGCDRIDHRVHCIETTPYGMYYHDKEESDAPFLSGDRSHLPLILSMISLFKASPFLLKPWIYDEGRYRDANSEMLRVMTANTYKAKEWGFLRVLARERNIKSKSKTFKFVQLAIPHPPNALSADCTLQPEQATILTESICALKELGVLLAWLKENGAYDATKIVVVSDHGWWIDNPMFPRDFGQAVPEGRYRLAAAGIVQSLLLVKDFGAKGRMSHSETFVSNPDVPSIVCSTVVTCKDVGPNPTLVNLGERTLTFTVTAWPPDEERAAKHEIIDAYEVKNSIFDARNWKKVR